MEKIKIAIIGCGTIANSAHIPAYLKNDKVEIKYFCDIILEKAQKAVDKYGCGTAISDYKIILEDEEVKGVSVCTPNKMHSIISCDCLRAGKQVLCEKPAARVYSEALEMQKVAHETGRVLNIGVVNRFNTAVNMIKDKIDAGELGTVYQVNVNFSVRRSIPGLGGAFTTKSIAGGGALIDWGVHYLDIVMYCCNDPEPLTASGKAYCVLGKDMENYVYESMWAEDTKDYNGTYDVDDSVTAFIRTTGPAITVNGAWARNIGVNETFIDFLGDKAGIRLTYGGNFTIYGTKDGKLYSETPEFTATSHFQNEIDAFVECIETNANIRSNIDKAVLTSKIMQGIYDSSESGKEIVF
ncbi:MAG: Gfo/Idh/MocA family oxidoreductase [Ruminococcaceae bacterium]|nr:Gfo/Idh/MocA family oxidoreductase [Oscillospiraceae bacterium]